MLSFRMLLLLDAICYTLFDMEACWKDALIGFLSNIYKFDLDL